MSYLDALLSWPIDSCPTRRVLISFLGIASKYFWIHIKFPVNVNLLNLTEAKPYCWVNMLLHFYMTLIGFQPATTFTFTLPKDLILINNFHSSWRLNQDLYHYHWEWTKYSKWLNNNTTNVFWYKDLPTTGFQ